MYFTSTNTAFKYVFHLDFILEHGKKYIIFLLKSLACHLYWTIHNLPNSVACHANQIPHTKVCPTYTVLWVCIF